MSKQPPATNRAFVLGLDGVPWDLIERWAGDGTLPNFARLIEEGAAGPLESTTPDTTALAWPTIATGARPDKHGVYAFQHLEPGYTHRMNTSDDVKRPELWDVVSPAVVANVPMTYPADAVDGTLVAGMMSPEMDEGFAHPSSVAEEIAERIPEYRIGLSWSEYRDRPEEFTAELSSLLAARRKLMRHLMEEERWRLFFFVYTAPDRLQHLVWDDDVLAEHYRELDDILGEVLDYVSERDAALFVVSDHGFGPVSRFVFLNALLEREGYLTRRDRGGTRGALERLGLTKSRVREGLHALGIDDHSLLKHLPRPLVDSVATRVPGDHSLYDVEFEQTVAFAHGPGNVYVNDTGRFDPGVVDPAEAPRVKADLLSLLDGLTDPETGAAALEVHDGDEVFPTDPDSPDVVVRGRDGYEVGTSLTERVFTGNRGKVASHRSEGVFLAWGDDVGPGAKPTDATVADVAPTVLHGLGEPVPSNADGRVLREVFAPGSPPDESPVETRTYADAADDRPTDAERDFDGVEDRLRGLGYME